MLPRWLSPGRDRRCRGVGVTGSGLAFLALVLAISWPGATARAQAVFGHTGIALNSFEQVGKWTDMRRRHGPERTTMRQPCQPTAEQTCQLADWWSFLQGLAGTNPRRQIDEINAIMNTVPYVEDIRNYLISDYWATPGQFFDQNGDCEDYAIAKFMSLRLLGFPNDQMRLVVLQDENLGIAHAVLVVYLNGEALMLDNQISQVVPTSAVRHYRPYYSLNEENVWSHMN